MSQASIEITEFSDNSSRILTIVSSRCFGRDPCPQVVNEQSIHTFRNVLRSATNSKSMR